MSRKKKVEKLLSINEAIDIVRKYNIEDTEYNNAIAVVLDEIKELQDENNELTTQNINLNDELIMTKNSVKIANLNILDDTFDMVKTDKPKAKKADLELGNIMFNRNHQQLYRCPDYVIAFLRDISRKLEILMVNSGEYPYDNPFDNTGNVYKNSTFEVQAYSWNDDVIQDYNFKWRDVEISWYKYLGRDTTINGEYSYQYMVMMLDKCIASLHKINENLSKYN